MAENENYIATLPCGCIVGAVAISADLKWNKKNVAPHVKRWIGEGYKIECVSDHVVRESNWKGCEVCKPAPVNTGQIALGI